MPETQSALQLPLLDPYCHHTIPVWPATEIGSVDQSPVALQKSIGPTLLTDPCTGSGSTVRRVLTHAPGLQLVPPPGLYLAK